MMIYKKYINHIFIAIYIFLIFLLIILDMIGNKLELYLNIL